MRSPGNTIPVWIGFFYFCRVKNEDARARDKTGTVCSPQETWAQNEHCGLSACCSMAPTAKTVSLTSEIRPSPETPKKFLISIYILSMWSKRHGIQIKLKRIFSLVLLTALHSSDDVADYVPISSRSSDSFKDGLVSAAQTTRCKKRLKVNEFRRGFEDFPIYFPFTIIRLRPERHLLVDLHQI